VRAYELDTHGHVTTAAYLQYGDHARWKLLQAAGIDLDELRRVGLGPVTLETTVRFVRSCAAARRWMSPASSTGRAAAPGGCPSGVPG
jgi:acyl-CoA thioester hydrolase